ncbi:hypothetical protein [Lacimicrobium alkaliphilum]|uniref:Surface antigen domain-containing protein n=1 Tax=Lacimicrobium alkaliphilum TaxID=1526571 RepID=A0A0U3AMM9_9ALTE|nr:hypothetical protein [Lacimicrobium alkaliphilum]ALS99234.1 hypothetical protein AT746_13865 [Lacimicrobium alkaliphilum]
MRLLLVLITTLLASGCQLTQAEEAVPAVIINPGEEVKTELQQMIQQAIGGLPVKLADDALTKRNILYIEQNMGSDAQGNPIMGRHNNKPEVFRLQIKGGQCQLIHGASGKVFTLQQASCRALDAR